MTGRHTEPFDPGAFRNCLGQFPTGVCIVTAKGEGEPVGMTISSFNSLSLDPPLVLFSIGRNAQSLPAWEAAPGYALHVLSQSQDDLSNRFARAASNKWEGVAYTGGLHDAPLLAGAVAVMECAAHACHDGGDHLLFIARVERFRVHADRNPLVFCRGRYRELGTTNERADLWPLDIHY
ncbi:MAG: flavin reductase family protein [Rhodobiaceae bacterium]|nr:flavin reductase family protein [Rhodobiaceae bacterium]